MRPARSQIDQKKWAAAVDELRSVNDTGSADWNKYTDLKKSVARCKAKGNKYVAAP